MTQETYEQAIDLRTEMDRLMWLLCLLSNASSEGHSLAALAENHRVLNESSLSNELCATLSAVVRAEYDKLNEKFLAL